MSKRLLSGSLLGMDRSKLHSVEANPFVRIFLDEKVDSGRLSAALSRACEACPYMNLTVEADEGIFLQLTENEQPLRLLTEEPDEINCSKNNGHSAAVYCRDNIIGVMVSHALTDGMGFFLFVRTLMDLYYGENEGIYSGYGKPGYDTDPMELELSVPDDFQPVTMPEGEFFTIPPAKELRFDDAYMLRIPYAEYKALCTELDSSAQNVLTMIGMRSLADEFKDTMANIVSRLPINARKMLGIPDSFQNASLANMRICFPADRLRDGDDATLLHDIKEQTVLQNTASAVSYQYIQWRKVLYAKDRDERMGLIIPMMGQDALLISNLGRGLIGEGYCKHVTGVLAGSMVFPLMLYGIVSGENMFLTGYDAGEKNEYKKALITELKRRNITVEELDPATGKTI